MPDEETTLEDEQTDELEDEDQSDETPSEDDEDPDAPAAEDEDDDEDGDTEDDEQDSPEDDDDEDGDDESWTNFQKKFGHLRSDRDRRAAMGKAYWDKTNYASRVRKENEELRAKVAAQDSKPKEPENTEPPPPHPDVQKLTGRIESLTQKGEQLQTRAQDTLIKLAESDKSIAKFEAKMEDAEDYQKEILAAKLETAQMKKDTLLQRYADINEKAEALSFDVERIAQDREWLLHTLKDQEARKQKEAQEDAEFEKEFPQEIATLIQQAATEAEVPKTLVPSVMKSVNKSLLLDLWNLGDADISTVDMPGLVQAHLDEYLKDRDLADRARFAKKSKEKRSVVRGNEKKTPKGTPPRKTVDPGALNQGDLGPKMAAARARLGRHGL